MLVKVLSLQAESEIKEDLLKGFLSTSSIQVLDIFNVIIASQENG
jgi:hypothetical protein